jgi:hypothetical protein
MSRIVKSAKVLGYAVMHRHGQRAPIRNLFEINEINFWNDKLPSQDRLRKLSDNYPISFHHRGLTPIDLKYKPLSCLTDLGVDYMTSVGQKTNELFPLMNHPSNFKVYSTNYHRTQVRRTLSDS